MSTSNDSLEQLAINTIRTLSMDAVQAARSGHPGTPMALAPAGYVLFNEFLRFDPNLPNWCNRDRFVLSCGHASTLLYSLLHLAGVKQLDQNDQPTDELAVPLEHLRQFRQMGSRCPGHPEYRHTSGVEITTGPLGQGIASSVGMAIASRWLGEHFNRPDHTLFDFDTYAICSDGDLMEGIGSEAASLAGHLKLSNLCWIYDNNRITIEGTTSLAFTEDVGVRFAGYGWHVVEVDDINELEVLRAAFSDFRETSTRPTLIVVRSEIAWGSPNMQNTPDAHGAPLGEEEIRLTKQAYGWPEDASFLVPEEVVDHFRQGIGTQGPRLSQEWNEQFAKYREKYPDLAAELDVMQKGELPKGWDADVALFEPDPQGMASRASSGKVLNQVAKNIPWMLGGSADLAPSNKSLLSFDGAGDFQADSFDGRNFHFGIREHAMGAICNGMALSGLRTYGATFFVFADYLRPSIRLAALMQLPVFYIFTHDSIGVGEDGPTHQPVEQLASLRAIPGLLVFRPADANEVAEAYKAMVSRNDRPAALVLTRQNLPTLDRTKVAPASGMQQGGYTLLDAPSGKPEVLLIGTGSEVSLCIEAWKQLTAEGIQTRVVSLPCWELFDAQLEEYRNSVLLPEVTTRIGVEMGTELGWGRYLGIEGCFIGMEGFGASAPFKQLLEHFGFTVENIVAQTKAALARK